MRLDASGQLIDITVPETVSCTVCSGRAERLSSAFQGEGRAYHHYRCRTDGCPAGGTIVEHESGNTHRVGPVFCGRDLAVRLAAHEHRPREWSNAVEVRS